MTLGLKLASRTAILSCCSIIALAAAGRVQAAETAGAAAPAPTATGPAQLEEVVVTAQRVEQKLQKVPVAETAFNHAALVQHGIAKVEDVQFHVPNINVREESDNGGLSIGIRGISVSAENFSYDSAVGVYVNGVFIARGQDFNATFFDVSGVQVLRGPQGTLFGQDTPAGAVLVDTTRPGSSYGGYLDANVGVGGNGIGAGANRNIYRFEGAVDLPVAQDLNIRLAGYHVNDSGFAESLASGIKNDSKDDAGIRATAVFTPTNKFSATLILDYNHKNDGAALFVPVEVKLPISALPYDELNGGLAAQNALIAAAAHPNPYFGRSIFPGQGVVGQTYSAALLLNYQLSDNWDLRSITGYRHMTNNSTLDNDSLPLPETSGGTDNIQQAQISQEFDLNGDVTNKLHVIGGLYYFNETGFERNFFPIAAPVAPGVFLPAGFDLQGNDISNSSEAVFVNASYKILPDLTLTAGVRYTWDQKGLDLNDFLTIPSFGLTVPTATGPVAYSDRTPVYDAKLTWQALPNLLLYASYGTGYRSGGIGYRATDTVFTPETSETYEVGGKWDFHIGSMPARLNTALFDTQYKNFQLDVIVSSNGEPAQAIVNAGAATIMGAELEFSVRPTQNLELAAQLGLLDAHYDSFILNSSPADLGVLNLKHNQLRDAPPASLSLSAVYTVPTKIGDWVYAVDYAYSTAYETDTIFQSDAPGAAQTNAFHQSPTNIVNARITLAKAFGSNWDLSIWGKNLTDQERIVFTLAQGSNPGSEGAATYGEPRSLGIELRTRF